jgi:hypothetical protein
MTAPALVPIAGQRAEMDATVRGGATAVVVRCLFDASGALVDITPDSLSKVISEEQATVAKRLGRLAASLRAYGSVAAVQTELVCALQLANALADLERAHGPRAAAMVEAEG